MHRADASQVIPTINLTSQTTLFKVTHLGLFLVGAWADTCLIRLNMSTFFTADRSHSSCVYCMWMAFSCQVILFGWSHWFFFMTLVKPHTDIISVSLLPRPAYLFRLHSSCATRFDTCQTRYLFGWLWIWHRGEGGGGGGGGSQDIKRKRKMHLGLVEMWRKRKSGCRVPSHISN